MPDEESTDRASTDSGRRLTRRFTSTAKPGDSLGSMRYALAGLSSGFISSFLLHPLDVVNTRLQVHDGNSKTLPKYRSTAHALVRIAGDDGLLALYSGLVPNLFGQTISWGCFFWTHANIKAIVRARKGKGSERAHSAQLVWSERLGCSAGAGMVTATVTQPIWVIKTRLQLQSSSFRVYSGVLDVVRGIWNEEGVRGLWRGLSPSLLLVSNIAIQMFLYEDLHSRLQKQAGPTGRVPTSHTFLCGAAAKVCASCGTYPLMVVRTRLQQRDPSLSTAGPAPPGRRPRYYAGAVDVVRKTWAGEGLGGFYKGLGTNLVRVVPAAAINFAVYEAVKQRL